MNKMFLIKFHANSLLSTLPAKIDVCISVPKVTFYANT